VATTPALTPLVLDAETSLHRDLAGVSHDVEIAIWVERSIATRLAGPMLWTHIGASGPAAMNASRHWLRAQLENRPVRATLSCCPGQSFDTIDVRLRDAAASSPRGSVQSLLASIVPAAVASALLGQLTIDPRTPLAHLARHDRRRVARALVEWELPIAG